MTPKGHPATHVPHPLQMSSWTTTVSNSVRNRAPVGHTSRQPAWVQCLHTSEDISHRNSSVSGGVVSAAPVAAGSRTDGGPGRSEEDGAPADRAPEGGKAVSGGGPTAGIPRSTSRRPDSRAV